MSDRDSHDPPAIDPSAFDARGLETVGKIFDTARADAVWGSPIRAGEYTVVTASEVLAAGGAGFGGGVRPDGPRSAGSGGGGGGYSAARPVATVTIGPDGVRVRPVFDVTKIALAFLTTVGTLALMFARLARAARK